MVTQAERNAALQAAYAEVLKVIAHMVPVMFQSFANSYIAAHPELVRDISDACLNAAAHVRNPATIPVPAPAPEPKK